MFTISKLAKMFSLSRTALLYYDSIGLLKSSKKSSTGYRLYDEKDIEKLKIIILYRSTGLSLQEIKKIINSQTEHNVSAILIKKLGELNQEIEKIKSMQNIIIEILKDKKLLRKIFQNDKEALKKILKETGINEKNALKWHEAFEKNSPQMHETFLKILGFTKSEINILDSIEKTLKI